MLTRKFVDLKKVKVIGVTDRSNVNWVKLQSWLSCIVHSSYAKQVIVPKVVDRWTDPPVRDDVRPKMSMDMFTSYGHINKLK